MSIKVTNSRVFTNSSLKKSNNNNNNTNNRKNAATKTKARPKLARKANVQRKLVRVRRRVNRKNFIPRSIIPRNGSIMNNPYFQCRANPFDVVNGSMGTPVSNVRRITIDHRYAYQFQVGSSGGFNIALTNAIPYPVWYNALKTTDTTFSVNGRTPTHHVGAPYNFFATPLVEYDQLAVTLYDSDAVIDKVAPYLGASKARIASAAWNLMYTGNTLSNSGTIRVNRTTMSTFAQQRNPTNYTVYNADGGTDKTWSTNQLLTRAVNFDPSFFAANQTTKVIRLAEGAHGRLAFIGDDHDWQDYCDNLQFLNIATQDNLALLCHNNLGTEGTLSHWPVLSFLDPNWGVTLIRVDGAQPGSTFILDFLYCCEYVPATTSQVYALAKQPKVNEELVRQVDEILSHDAVAEQGAHKSTTGGLLSDTIIPMATTVVGGVIKGALAA